jgi:glycosyltransferase involved in cell wall biosynthesis
MRTLVVNALRVLGKPTGPGRHIEFLAQQWSRTPIPFDRLVLMSPRPPQLDRLGTATPIEFRGLGGQWPNLLWEQWLLPRAARGAAMLFCPTYTGPLWYPGKMVVANHGIYEALPEEFSRWQRLRALPLNRGSAQRADRVIANSLSTKRDLIKYFGLPEAKIDVIYPAAHELFFESYGQAEIAAEVRRVFGEQAPYVIFIGKLAKRRNVPNLIAAFAQVRQREQLPHRLLIVGPNTSGLPLAQLAAEFGVAQAVTYIPYMEQPPLAKLCAGADLYVLPTIYEGISQTMFEAMASGTAVLSVDHPTLAEGGADAVFSVSTPSVDDLAQGLTALLTNAELRRAYAQKGRARAAHFSWRITADKTMEILDRVAPPADDVSSNWRAWGKFLPGLRQTP